MANSSGSFQSGQRGRLVERVDLLLDQRQVVQRIEHEVLALVGARMPGDDLRAAGDHHLVHVAAHEHLAVPISSSAPSSRCAGSAPATARRRASATFSQAS